MNPGVFISVAAACVSASGACVAWWQVRAAQRAAPRRAAATEDQSGHERAPRDGAERPRFDMLDARPDHGHGREPRIVAEIRQTTGPPLAEAHFAAYLDDEPAAIVTSDSAGTPRWQHTGPGTVRTVTVRAAARHHGSVEVRLDLDCREAHGDRRWLCRVVGYTRAPGNVPPARASALTGPRGTRHLPEPAFAYPGAGTGRAATSPSSRAAADEIGLLSLTPVPVAAPDGEEDIW